MLHMSKNASRAVLTTADAAPNGTRARFLVFQSPIREPPAAEISGFTPVVKHAD